MVNAPERDRSIVSELVECRPTRQLTVQAIYHINLSKVMIAGKSFGQLANKRLGLFPGYR